MNQKNMNIPSQSKMFYILTAIGVLILTYVAYYQGLNGGFLLDDEVNLINLNIFKKYDGIDAFIRYIMSNQTGHIKRPVTTLSFLLNATEWPATAYSFKLTNLLLHIFNGFILFFVTKKLLLQFRFNEKEVEKIALLSMAFWVLHPFLLSTTLYVSQRMAILPTTFVLVGLFFYLKGLEIIVLNKNKGRMYLFIGAYVCTVLAVLSKENGVLLPIFLLLLEFFLGKKSPTNTFKFEKRILVIFPSVLIALVFILKSKGFVDAFVVREYTAWERLLTQSRVLTTYLQHLFIPEYFTEGVFTDGFTLSKSILHPITTLYSSLFIMSLLFGSFFFRKKYPIVGFSILFYFTGHILESTFLNLELYFEHRNYLPSIFLFIPVAMGLIKLINRSKVYILLPIFIIVLLAFLTNLRAKLWGDDFILHSQSAQKFPESFRAIEQRAVDLMSLGMVESAREELIQALLLHSNVSLRLRVASIDCVLSEGQDIHIEDILSYLKMVKITRLDRAAIVGLMYKMTRENCGDKSLEWADSLLDEFKKNPGYANPDVKQSVDFFYGMLLMKQGKFTEAQVVFDEYIDNFEGYDDNIIAINRFIEYSNLDAADHLILKMEQVMIDKNSQYTRENYKDILLKLKLKIKKLRDE